ncbi:N-acetylmuramoyl-L-alanine amidase family protein [Flavobacterium terrae]|uniref:N-acetylmuramoyl-L-alanine amidase n=1 Tax=Flavobacterium terrae TaxID=415425 RepID=A0A1M6GPP6_9FLAO|nr:N-acetylmuramoyl-L-alanine amidase [Flavobacterium terrae]SHJ11810.1 N-acetylmuramoyl-L-alanine amidase [Flavobacterium terrae]
MRKALKSIVLLLSIGLLLSFNSNDPKKIKVVIDAGHGGTDFGGMHSGLNEKDLTLSIINKIKALHNSENVELFFTRNNDELISLSDRVQKINEIKPDLVISLHVNNNKNPESNGVEVYVPKDLAHTVKSEELANKFLGLLVDKTSLMSRGVKTAPFLILKKSNCPTILAEVGFMSNYSDRKIITSDENQNRVAQAVIEFISQIE